MLSSDRPPRTRRAAAVAVCVLALSAAGCRHAAAHAAPGGIRVFVSNEDSNDVSVIDADTDAVVKTIPVGKRPRGIRVAADGAHAYVALSGSPKTGPGVDDTERPPPDRAADGIGVIDARRGVLERVLPSGPDPESFDLSKDGNLLFVSNEDTGALSVVDVRSGKVIRSVPVGGEPEGVAVRPDGKVAYVTSEKDNSVAVVDADSNGVIARIATGLRPRGVAFSPDGTRAFVTNELSGSLTLVDSRRHVATAAVNVDLGTELASRPMGITVSARPRRVYVTTGRAGGVAAIDEATGRVRSVLRGVGARPWGIGVTHDGRKLYVANGPSNDVAVIDAVSFQIIRRVRVGRSPWGVAVTSR